MLPELTSQHIIRNIKQCFIYHLAKYNIILHYAKEPCLNICLNINLHGMKYKNIKVQAYVSKIVNHFALCYCCKSNASQNTWLIGRVTRQSRESLGTRLQKHVGSALEMLATKSL